MWSLQKKPKVMGAVPSTPLDVDERAGSIGLQRISHHRIFRGLDSVRLVKRFKELTTRTERKEFLTLFI